MIGLALSTILAALFESLFYGVLTVMFVASLRITYGRTRKELASSEYTGVSSSKSNTRTWKRLVVMPMVWGTLIIYVTSTLHLIVIYDRLCRAILTIDTFPDLTFASFDPLFASVVYRRLAKSFSVILTTITLATANSMFIYRSWILWGRRLVPIILPTISLTGFIVANIGVVWWNVQIPPSNTGTNAAISKWVTATYACDATTCIYCTISLATRVYLSSRPLLSLNSVLVRSRPRHFPIVSILLESALLYSVFSLTFIILYMTSSTAYLIAYESMPPISGIAFLLIQLRVELRTMFAQYDISSNMRAQDTVTHGGEGRLSPVPTRVIDGSKECDISEGNLDASGATRAVELRRMSTRSGSVMDEGAVESLRRALAAGA